MMRSRSLRSCMRWWSKEWLCETKEKAWCRGVGSRDLLDDYNYASLRDSTRALE